MDDRNEAYPIERVIQNYTFQYWNFWNTTNPTQWSSVKVQ